MLLRASGEQTGDDVNLEAVIDGSGMPGIRWGRELNRIVEAVIARDAAALDESCSAAEPIMGDDAVRDALVVAAAFNGITRVADATGIPLDEPTAAATGALRSQLGIDAFDYDAKSQRYA